MHLISFRAKTYRIIQWQAHEGIILSLSWSSDANVIASGGEDYRFKLWDGQGNNLFTSSIEENAITSVAFNPERDILLVGTFNMIKLCSINGVSWSFVLS